MDSDLRVQGADRLAGVLEVGPDGSEGRGRPFAESSDFQGGRNSSRASLFFSMFWLLATP